MKHWQENFGIELTKVKAVDTDDLSPYIKPNTKVQS